MAKDKPKQEAIPGTLTVKHEKLHNLALLYAEARDAETVAKKRKETCRDSLVAEMHEQEITTYKHGSVSVTLIPGADTLQLKITPEDE